MKKMILFLAVLVFAVPAVATVTVTAERLDATHILIRYDVNGDDAAVGLRALALSLTVDGDATISAIEPNMVGESTSAIPGYGIFVGSIDLADPCNPVWGDPVASEEDPDNPGQLDSNSIIVEFGSLYVGEANAPDDVGELCTITLSKAGVVTPAADALRGGIVMEDPDENPTEVVMVASEAGCACWGELNGDSVVSIGDAAVILGYLNPDYAGSTPYPYTGPVTPALECGELNGDSVISIGDAAAILGYLNPDYAGSTPYPYTGPCMP